MKLRFLLVGPFLASTVLGFAGSNLLAEKTLLAEAPSPATTPTLLPTKAPILAPTSIATPSPSPTPQPTATPTPQPTGTFTPMPTPTIQLAVNQEQIQTLIDQYAGQYHISPHVLRHIAICESGLNPAAANLNYGGLYQFHPGTWQKYRRQMNQDPNPELRFDTAAAIETAAYVLSVSQAHVWPNCVPKDNR